MQHARIPGDPKPLIRARVGRSGKGRKRHVFDPPRNVELKGVIAQTWKDRGYARHEQGRPLELILVFAFQRPLDHWVGRRRGGVLREDAKRWHTQTPDDDNLRKLVKDALNNVAWHDDAQVAKTSSRKVWVEDEGYTAIFLRALPDA
jgi:Holliday junction resolvase RusA-like endonuclease